MERERHEFSCVQKPEPVDEPARRPPHSMDQVSGRIAWLKEMQAERGALGPRDLAAECAVRVAAYTLAHDTCLALPAAATGAERSLALSLLARAEQAADRAIEEGRRVEGRLS